jgi:hypothetical protein
MRPLAQLVIQFLHQAFVAIFYCSTVFAFFKQAAQRTNFSFIVFEEPEGRTNNLTCRSVAPIFKLMGYEAIKVFAQADTCFLAMLNLPTYQIIPNHGVGHITRQGWRAFCAPTQSVMGQARGDLKRTNITHYPSIC